jgi:hypothetical protein
VSGRKLSPSDLLAKAQLEAVLGARAIHRDTNRAKPGTRDFDLEFSDRRLEPLEVTEHIDEAFRHSADRIRRSVPIPAQVGRNWRVSVPPTHDGSPLDVAAISHLIVPLIERRDRDGGEHLDLQELAYSCFPPDASEASASARALLDLGIRRARSRPLQPGQTGGIELAISFGGYLGARTRLMTRPQLFEVRQRVDDYRTTRRVKRARLPQSTITGQRPSFVFDPTFHRQVIRPPVFARSPAALEGPVG